MMNQPSGRLLLPRGISCGFFRFFFYSTCHSFFLNMPLFFSYGNKEKMSGMWRGFVVALDMPLICFLHAAHFFFVAIREKMSGISSGVFLL